MENIKLNDANQELFARTKGGSSLMFLITLAALVVYVTTGQGAVAVELAMVALSIGVVQQLWQGFAMELWMRQMKRLQSDDLIGNLEYYGYPSYIATVDIIIYMLKMIVIIMAAVELILSL